MRYELFYTLLEVAQFVKYGRIILLRPYATTTTTAAKTTLKNKNLRSFKRYRVCLTYVDL